MSDQSEKILSKVRALLAQAEDPAATPEEAETFSRKAEELIAKYAIDLALVEAKAEHKGKPTMRSYAAQEPYSKAKATLLSGIATTHGCKIVRVRGVNGETWKVVGFESDLELVDVLFTSLLVQGTNALLHQYRSDRSFRTSYWYGFAGRVYTRLQEMRTKAEAESHEVSTALVLANRQADVDTFYAEQYPRVRKASPGRVRDRGGFRAGQDAANRADLGGQRVSGGSRAALH